MRNKFFRMEKISWKLTLLYSLLFSGVLLLLSFCVLYGLRYYMISQAYESVKSSTAETVSMILDTDSGKLNLSSNDLLTEAQSDSDISVIIAGPDGKIVNESSNYIIKDNNILSHIGVLRRAEVNGMHLVMLNSEVRSGSRIVAYLQIALSLEKSYRYIGILFWLLAIADSIGILASVLVGYIVSKRMLRPIDKVTRTAQSISINDLGGRIPVGKVDDEISRLAVTFNSMLDRLQDSIEKQAQFVSDASHELRTPISVVLGYASLLDRWGKDDRKVLQESVDAIKNETLGMRELVEKLLFLARNDSGKMPVHKAPFDVSELLRDVAEESSMIAPGRNIACDCPESLTLNADRNLVKQMLRNLIDNSIKFTKSDGTIRIHAATGDESVRIVVEDNGIGVPANEVGHVFDRFYRVDKARAKETGGSGLGLAIVKSIAELHGGDISMESTQGKGTSVTIMLPCR